MEHETIASALVSALTDLTNVAKGHKANAGKMSYSFANIADLIAETRPVLAEHGLVALTPIHEHAEGLACTVTILHKSGERMDFGPTPFPAGKDAQSTGSWITYMRRYCLLAALGMGAEDDDGAGAKAGGQRQPEAQTYTAAAAKKSLLDRLHGIDEPEKEAVRIWQEHIGDSRAITQGEWQTLSRAVEQLHADHAADPWGGT